MYTVVVYLKKRSATIVSYLPTPNGRPVVVKKPRAVAEELVNESIVKRTWAVGDAKAVSLKVRGRGLVVAVKIAGCGSLATPIIDREVRRAYKESADLIRRNALSQGVPEDVVDSYIKAWLKAVDGQLPPDDPDAKAVAERAPWAVVWAYGRYLVQSPPWC